MRTVQLLFRLLLCCGAADAYRDLLVDLGQNLTLGCEISVKDVHWYLMKPSLPTVFILRSFMSRDSTPHYGDPAFRERFSLKLNSSLFIHKITENELGFYYCIINNDSSFKISSGIRLNIRLNRVDSNQTEAPRNETDCRPDEGLRNLQTLLMASGLLSFVLVFAVTGVIVLHCKKTPACRARPPDLASIPSSQHLMQRQDLSHGQFEEIERPSTSGSRITAVNSTYAMLDFPQPQRGT